MKNWSVICIALILFSCKSKEKISTNSAEKSKVESGKMIKYKAGNVGDWSFIFYYDNTVDFSRGNNLLVNNKKMLKRENSDGEIPTYFTIEDENLLQFSIKNQKCFNTQSGKEKPRTIEINYRGEVFSSCLINKDTTIGPDLQWKLIMMQGSDRTKLSLNGELPYIVINLEKNGIYGSTGCNNFHGKIKYSENFININQLVSTKMACKYMDIENEFLNNLEQVNRVERDDVFLYFYISDELLMKFRLAE